MISFGGMLAQLGSAIVIIPLIAILESVAIAKAFGEFLDFEMILLPSWFPFYRHRPWTYLVDKCAIRDGEIQGYGQKLRQFIEECEERPGHTKEKPVFLKWFLLLCCQNRTILKTNDKSAIGKFVKNCRLFAQPEESLWMRVKRWWLSAFVTFSAPLSRRCRPQALSPGRSSSYSQFLVKRIWKI